MTLTAKERASVIICYAVFSIVRGSLTQALSEAQKRLTIAFLIAIRTPILALCFLGLIYREVRKDPKFMKNVREGLKSESLLKFFLMGAFQAVLPTLFFTQGLKRAVTPGVGAVLQATAPMFVLLFQKIKALRPEGAPDKPWSERQRIGFALGLLGIITILMQNSDGNTHSGYREVSAYVVFMTGVLCWGFAGAFWKKHKGENHYLVSALGQNTCAGILGLYISFMYEFEGSALCQDYHLQKQCNQPTDQAHWSFDYGNIDLWLAVLWLSVMSGVLAAVMMYYCFEKIGPAATNTSLFFVMIIGTIEGAVIDDSFSDKGAAYIALHFIGMILIGFCLVLLLTPEDMRELARLRGDSGPSSSGEVRLGKESSIEMEDGQRRSSAPDVLHGSVASRERISTYS